MPSKASGLTLRDSSIVNSSSASNATPALASPRATTAGFSELSPALSSPSQSIPKAPSRCLTFDSLLSPGATKSPRPGDLPLSPPGNTLHKSKTAPATGKRHKSESAIVAPSTTPTSDSFFQMRVKEKSPSGHYGRHGNDWLFGGLGIRETAKGLISRQNS